MLSILGLAVLLGADSGPQAASGRQSAPAPASALLPEYRWQALASCPGGVVIARVPVYPGRLAIVQDLGCELDYLDIDGRRARVASVLTPRLTLQRLGLFAVPLEWTPGMRTIGACAGSDCFGLELPIEDVPYPKSPVTVSKKFVSPPAAEQARIKRDQAHIAQAFALAAFDAHEPSPLCAVQQFEWPWRLPRPPVYTSVFGAHRVYNNKTQSRHLGTDFDGEIGEPIMAAQAGTVVLAEDLFYSGNSVFLSHGLGLLTTYFHMTKIEVSPGQRVLAGDKLGTIGRTGRVTGPHLHFAAKLWGSYFEPTELFDLDLSDIE